MKRKWRDRRGETLVEVLAAILIGALSAALLFSAVSASISMNQSAREADEALRVSLNMAEGQTAGSPGEGAEIKEGTVNVKNIDSDNPAESGVEVPVRFYGGKGAWSFALPSSAPPAEGGSE